MIAERAARGTNALRLFYELGQAIAEGRGIRDVMSVAVRVIVEGIPGTERVVLTEIDEETGSMFIEEGWGISDEERLRGVYRPGEGITGRVARTGEGVAVPRISEEPEFLNRTRSRSDGDREQLAFICVPIKIGREVLGTLSVDRSAEDSRRLEADRELLAVVAATLAQAVLIHRASAAENNRLRAEVIRLHEELEERHGPSSIVGNSHAMKALYSMILKVASKPTPVLVLGESGTGKELVASALHYQGGRAEGPFVKFNCAAVPESLAESEMFGHERGAFTGAEARRIGRFEEASGGTLFMDEVGELSLAVQAKLLRALQEREIERVGGSGPIAVDVRIVAATNRDLARRVREGLFREDLYYRLCVFPILLPPLRERGSDILLLADHFVEKYARLHGSPVRRISTPAIDALMAYHWPGNVRELENVIERAIILSDDGVIHAYNLPPTLQAPEPAGIKRGGSLAERLRLVELDLIVDALKASRGNMAQASRALGITERVMALRVRGLGVDYRHFRPRGYRPEA